MRNLHQQIALSSIWKRWVHLPNNLPMDSAYTASDPKSVLLDGENFGAERHRNSYASRSSLSWILSFHNVCFTMSAKLRMFPHAASGTAPFTTFPVGGEGRDGSATLKTAGAELTTFTPISARGVASRAAA